MNPVHSSLLPVFDELGHFQAIGIPPNVAPAAMVRKPTSPM
jgi:hypothetical protein